MYARRCDLHAQIFPLIGGIALLLVGSAMMVDQLGFTIPYRWVFLILLAPGGLSIVDGMRIGRIWGWSDTRVMARIIAGAAFALMAIVMTLGIDPGVIMPALLIALGAGSVLRALARARMG